MASPRKSEILLVEAFFLVFIVSLLCVAYGTGKTVRCIERERQSLLTFKNVLGTQVFPEYDHYGVVDLSSWGSEEDKRECCNWRGIRCSNTTGHVIALDLSSVGATFDGKFSPALLELQDLYLLDLSGIVTGKKNYQILENYQIPVFMASFKKLQHLNLQSCQFFGVIPDELGNLTNLKTLHLGDNYDLHSDNLEWVSRLSSLTLLDLSLSNITDPNWLQHISKLSSLQELYLDFCHDLPQITTPPPQDHFVNSSSSPLSILHLDSTQLNSLTFNWLVNLSTNIVTLDNSYNYEIGGPIPESLGIMISLENLYLSHNMFKGAIPKSLLNSSHMQVLDLSYNQITGPIPDFRDFILLRHLDLSHNQITGLIPDFGDFIFLEHLDLSHNQLAGSVPDLYRITSLRELHLGSNSLKGLLSPSILQLSKLEVLDVSNNSIEGTIHEAHLSQLHNLKVLDLSYNSLFIKINPSWVPPFQLNKVKLANCKIGPTFPKWIHTQGNVSHLDISSAGIVDVVPESFWGFSHIFEYFNISHNQLRGEVVDLSSNFVGVPQIDISTNNFSGPLPLLYPYSTVLRLSNNMFQGPISSICRTYYSNLKLLDLSANQLTGDIPDCWMNMTYLNVLSLSNNKFSGRFPQTLCPNIDILQILHLSNNNLTGKLPPSLKNCTYLTMLDVGENMLGGRIPSWIGTHLSNLTVLSLRHNNFFGQIPKSICHLTDIQVLDLSINHISGKIPQCFDNLISMLLKNITSKSKKPGYASISGTEMFELDVYFDYAIVQWKGRELEYRKTLGLLKLIDLSSNALTGSIPNEFCLLKALISLNLSRNHLTGNINSEIGDMEMLECLDLSNNHISGEIPVGLAKLSKLAVVDLSHNNLSGKIPSGPQLDTFNASVYAGNNELCGPPLNVCPGDDPNHGVYVDNSGKHDQEESVGIINQGFYICMSVGFVVGLWGVVVTLLLNKSRRNVCVIF